MPLISRPLTLESIIIYFPMQQVTPKNIKCARILKSEADIGFNTQLSRMSYVSYESVLNLATMRSLEHRRVEHSLILFYKSFKQNGPTYISNFFKLRNTPYALRGSGHNVVQDVYNSRYLHNSYKYLISHIWNQLPLSAKSSTSLSEFRNQIHQSDLLGCQCLMHAFSSSSVSISI